MYRWASAGKIKSYLTAGGHRRILPGELEEWMSDRQIPFDPIEFRSREVKILIVDDDIAVRNYLEKILSGIFINTDYAADGFDAGKKIIQFDPELIILDLFMPNMDGFEVCKKIKTDPLTKRKKILILSGQLTDKNREQAFSLGADAVLAKPSTKKEILDCVESLLKQI